MKELITIKGNKQGLQISVAKTGNFDEINQVLMEKMVLGRKFFGNSKVALSFTGREFREDELAILVETVKDNSDLEIVYILDNNVIKITDVEKVLENQNNVTPVNENDDLSSRREKAKMTSVTEPLKDAEIVIGTLRSGQEVNSQKSVVVIGDVNPGASIVAKGNVIVLGSLKGNVQAGVQKDKVNAFIIAIDFKPIQIRIHDLIARSSEQSKKVIYKKPQIAFVEDGEIIIDDLDNKIFKEITNLM